MLSSVLHFRGFTISGKARGISGSATGLWRWASVSARNQYAGPSTDDVARHGSDSADVAR